MPQDRTRFDWTNDRQHLLKLFNVREAFISESMLHPDVPSEKQLESHAAIDREWGLELRCCLEQGIEDCTVQAPHKCGIKNTFVHLVDEVSSGSKPQRRGRAYSDDDLTRIVPDSNGPSQEKACSETDDFKDVVEEDSTTAPSDDS